MNKLLVIMGSPRKGGNTDLLVDKAIDTWQAAGGAAEKIYVSKLNIRPCTGCGSCCKSNGNDTLCVIKDDMTSLYTKLMNADALLWATPIFMWSPTAQMKLFLDRLHPMGDYTGTRWSAALKDKPIGFIIVYAEPDPLDSGVSQTRDIMDAVAVSRGCKVKFTVHSTVGEYGSSIQDKALVTHVQDNMEALWKSRD